MAEGFLPGANMPGRGQRLPDLSFLSVDGGFASLSDFRGRSNLLLVLAGKSPEPLLEAAARRHAEVERWETVLIALLRSSREDALCAKTAGRWPFVVACDPDGSMTERLGFPLEDFQTAVCVTDRWGEVYFTALAGARHPDQEIEELLGWLEFVEYQCPECFPPEWRE